ncbi:late competence development ComFB family protein [Methylomonas sp. EFPC3]|uniref:late competence development ComFB family protein n=1 Tax=unclassified Methylomonas TaxID=2608980 RepID=UPI002416BD3D|nr:late competence development ComFB family protein [Methylomonas sp. EFPC3]WFP49069.1 late competence development ComFB family protein [Methylomonas sp. EFPC3]
MLNINNYYERLVIDRLWKLAEQSNEPFRQAFQEDVACLALNKLPPCYVRNTIDKGINVSEEHYLQMVAAVETAVEQAMQQVLSRPRLDRESAE